LGKLDLQTGLGMTRVQPQVYDRVNSSMGSKSRHARSNDHAAPTPSDPLATQLLEHPFGISGGVVYHAAEHFDVDPIRADFRWRSPTRSKSSTSSNVGWTFDG
jgi:hypothetical protein